MTVYSDLKSRDNPDYFDAHRGECQGPNFMNRFSAHSEEIAPFLAMEVMERGMQMQREGISIVQLGVGEPDFDAPEPALQEAISSLHRGDTHYTDSRGIYELREAIAEDCFERRGIRPRPEQIIVTSGTSPAIYMCLQLLVETGDEVLMATPHYPCYPNMVSLIGGRSILVPTSAHDGYVLDVERLKSKITPRTRAIILCSPANPTGAVQPKEVVEALSELDIPILSDEIYDGLVFDGAEVSSPMGLAKSCYVLDGFSKRYAMTGFRLGYVIAPEDAARHLQKIQQSLYISTAHFVQYAGIAALNEGEAHLNMMHDTYAKRRDLLIKGIRELGFEVPVDPAGAFYVLANANHLGNDSLELAFRILEHAKVALGPGRDFGEIAEGFLRFSYATSEAAIREGLRRIADALPHIQALREQR